MFKICVKGIRQIQVRVNLRAVTGLQVLLSTME